MKRNLCLLLIPLLLCGCSALQDGSKKNEQKATASLTELKETSEKNSERIKDDACYSYRRFQLEKELQDDYDRLYGAIYNHEEEVLVECDSSDVLEQLFTAVTYDHPELFWTNNEYKYRENDEKNSFTMIPSYAYDANQSSELQKQVDAEAEPILKKAQSMASDYEKVKCLYDWIIDETTYVNKKENNQNMLSMLLDKKAVCAGYSKAFKYLLDALKIPNAILQVQVKEKPEEYHVINMVMMDNEWYYLDPTAGDIKVKETYANYRYAYFAMTSKEIEALYIPLQEYEESDAYKNTFFYQKGAYLESYDENRIIEIITDNVNDPDPCLAIKCSDQDTYEAVQQLFQTQHIFELFDLAGYSPHEFEYYSLDDIQCFFLNYW